VANSKPEEKGDPSACPLPSSERVGIRGGLVSAAFLRLRSGQGPPPQEGEAWEQQNTTLGDIGREKLGIANSK